MAYIPDTGASQTVVMNNTGTLASSSNQQALLNQLASVVTTYGPTGTSARSTMEVSFDVDATAIDAFGRMRTSDPAYRFDGQQVYPNSGDVWDTFTTNGSFAFDSVNRFTTVYASAGTNVSVMQSHYYAPYTPGRSQLSFITFNMRTAPVTGQTKRVGYFDGSNGVFLEWDAATGVSVNIVSGTALGNQKVLQASWNIDKMDGTGRSGRTLDLTKVQILAVSLQALYAGRVIIGFDIDGQLWPVHQFKHANLVTDPYLQQASLPVRYESRGTNASNATSLDAICATVISEGGVELLEIPGRTFSISSGTVTTSVSSRRPVLTIRPKRNFNGVPNNTVVVPQRFSSFVVTNYMRYELVRNGTVTGPANTPYTDVDSTNSTVEYNTNGTAISGGQAVYTDYATGTAKFADTIFPSAIGRLLLSYSSLLPQNAADTFSFVVTPLSGTPSVIAGLGWKEIR